MKTLFIALFTCLAVLASTVSAKAANTVYLPFAALAATVQIVAANETPEFMADNIRLWHVSENGGSPAPALQCGNQHKLQIHVFGVAGDQGEQSRLNNIRVNVVRYDAQGVRTEKFFDTGKDGQDKGVVEIEFVRTAEIRISSDIDGRTVTSEVARVANLAYAIPTDRLIESGYCSDETSCQAFINANTCNGNFSWNVVFKRGY